MPFVTEQVWQALGQVWPRAAACPSPTPAAESVCIAAWPAYPRAGPIATAEQIVGLWQEAIKALRNLRAERNVPKDAKIAPILIAAETVGRHGCRQGEPFIRSLPPAASLTIAPTADRPAECAVAVLPDVEIILPLAGLIDKEAEAARAAEDPGRPRPADSASVAGEAAQRVVRRPGARPRSSRSSAPSSPSCSPSARRSWPCSARAERESPACVDGLRRIPLSSMARSDAIEG